MNDNTLSLLGLATRARATVFGQDAVLHQLATYEGNVLFLAQDAGQNITKKIENKAKTYQLTVIDVFTSDELSSACGKRNVTVLLVTDKGFSQTFKEYIKS